MWSKFGSSRSTSENRWPDEARFTSRAPGVAVDLRYHVGSKDEEPGRTGFAHLFEHLMFMGARHVPYPKFDTLMEAAGGTNNAFTNNDVTNYFEAGPANLLETFLWMEADRLATLGQEMTQEKLETRRGRWAHARGWRHSLERLREVVENG